MNARELGIKWKITRWRRKGVIPQKV